MTEIWIVRGIYKENHVKYKYAMRDGVIREDVKAMIAVTGAKIDEIEEIKKIESSKDEK